MQHGRHRGWKILARKSLSIWLFVQLEQLKDYEITRNNAYKPSDLLIKLAKEGGKLADSPGDEDRKEKLNFAKSSVAGNFQ